MSDKHRRKTARAQTGSGDLHLGPFAAIKQQPFCLAGDGERAHVAVQSSEFRVSNRTLDGGGRSEKYCDIHTRHLIDSPGTTTSDCWRIPLMKLCRMISALALVTLLVMTVAAQEKHS